MRAVYALLVLFSFGCSVEIPDGRFACMRDSECPNDFVCSGGFCRAGGADGGAVDAGGEDAGVDAADTSVDALSPDVPIDDAGLDTNDALPDAGPAGCEDFVLAIESSSVSNVEALVIDEAGNLYVGGFFEGALTFLDQAYNSPDGDLFVASFRRDGAPRWFYTEGGTGADRVFGLELLGNGELLVAGQTGIAARESARAFRLDTANGALEEEAEFMFPDVMMDHWLSDVAVVDESESYVVMNIFGGGIQIFRLNATTGTVTLFRSLPNIIRANSIASDGASLFLAAVDSTGGVLVQVEDLERIELGEHVRFSPAPRFQEFVDVATNATRLAVSARSASQYALFVYDDRRDLGDSFPGYWNTPATGSWNAVTFGPDARGPIATGFESSGMGSRLHIGYFDDPQANIADLDSSAQANVRGEDIVFSALCPQTYIVGQFDDRFHGLMSGPPRGFVLAQRL